MDFQDRTLIVRDWIKTIRANALVFCGLFLLILFRLGLQTWLYHSGFQALTADEFGRTVMAANWAQNPYLAWYGVWLPFHMYMVGAALWLYGDLMAIPRGLTILLGVGSILVMYILASRLLDNRKAGLIGACLLAASPVHVWLSSTPLTEIPYTVCILGCMASFIIFLKRDQPAYLWLSAACLALANGFRFEGWMVSLVFSLSLAIWGGVSYLRRQINTRSALTWLAAAGLPWFFPLAWMSGNYFATGDALEFLSSVKNYKLMQYGSGGSVLNYLRPFLQIDPYWTVLLIPIVFFFLFRSRRIRGMGWYLGMVSLPLVMFAVLHGGQIEPPANYIRYLAPFIFGFYPLLAGLMVIVAERWVSSQSIRIVILVSLVVIIMTTQTINTFAYTNDPSANGLAVGQRIREIRMQDHELQEKPVLIELVYWEYLAIHVGSNDLTPILYDRPVNIADRQLPSLLLEHPQIVRDCIARYQIGTIIVKSVELVQMLQSELLLSPGQVINGYTFFSVPGDFSLDKKHPENCPLSFGSGY